MKTLTREQYRAYLDRRREELEKLVGKSKPVGHQTTRAASFYLDAAADLDRIMAELWRLDQERKP